MAAHLSTRTTQLYDRHEDQYSSQRQHKPLSRDVWHAVHGGIIYWFWFPASIFSWVEYTEDIG